MEASGNQHKLTAYFGATKEDKNQKLLKVPNVMFTKDLKSQFHVQGSTMERTQNPYNYTTSKKKDSLNESFVIHLQNGTWSTHSNDCSREAVMARYSKCGDKHACQKCFDFPYIQLVKDRVKRMERIYHIEQYITEPTASKTGYLEVTNFLKTNISNSSPASKLLRERCVKYISHSDWIEKNIPLLRT